MNKPDKITIKQLQDALLDVDKPLNPRYLYRISDISEDDLAALQRTWASVPAWRRQAIFEDIEEIGTNDYILSFEAFARFGLQDSEPRVRELALRTLWDYELPELIPVFIDMMEGDEDIEVRAAAATALGQYIYLGEIEELPASRLHLVEEKLLQMTTGQNPTLVRRRALEALGFSSRDELPALIEAAYFSDSNEWLASALFAMGRSANRTWNSSVFSKLTSDVPDVLVEAVRAAGELEIKKAVPRLMDLLSVEDPEVRWASIWSLSQIGGEGIRERLEALYDQTDDDEEADFIDSALENLDFTEDIPLFDLLEVEDDDEGEEEDIYPNTLEGDEDLKD